MTDLDILSLGFDELDDDFADALRLAERLRRLLLHSSAILWSFLVQQSTEVRHLLGALQNNKHGCDKPLKLTG